MPSTSGSARLIASPSASLARPPARLTASTTREPGASLKTPTCLIAPQTYTASSPGDGAPDDGADDTAATSAAADDRCGSGESSLTTTESERCGTKYAKASAIAPATTAAQRAYGLKRSMPLNSRGVADASRATAEAHCNNRLWH